MGNSQGRYIVIPHAVIADESLPLGAKLLYGEINSLALMRGSCHATTKSLADSLNEPERNVKRWLHCLVERQLVTVSRRGQKRRIVPTVALSSGQPWPFHRANRGPIIGPTVALPLKEEISTSEKGGERKPPLSELETGRDRDRGTKPNRTGQDVWADLTIYVASTSRDAQMPVLSRAETRALVSVGGCDAIAKTEPAKLAFLRRDFLQALALSVAPLAKEEHDRRNLA